MAFDSITGANDNYFGERFVGVVLPFIRVIVFKVLVDVSSQNSRRQVVKKVQKISFGSAAFFLYGEIGIRNGYNQMFRSVNVRLSVIMKFCSDFASEGNQREIYITEKQAMTSKLGGICFVPPNVSEEPRLDGRVVF